jgi:murein DD-endopeptidase MepM/ murein hydrolase activator NlpD
VRPALARAVGAILAGLALLAAPARAQTPFAVSGPFTPGGLVEVRLADGVSALTLNDGPVPEAAPGRYLLAFGRDEEGPARLAARKADGTLVAQAFPLVPRSFGVQRLPALGVSDAPAPDWVKRRSAEVARTVAAKRAAALDRQAAEGWKERFLRPAPGRVTGVYGSQRVYGGLPRPPHWGLDIAAPTGTPVKAAASGIVRLAEGPFLVEGNLVLIDHGAGLVSVYIHLSEIRVTAGQRVRQGDIVGAVGTTGRSTGPHLHWGVSLLRPPEGDGPPPEIRLDPALLLAR